MLTNIENRLEELFEMIEMMPPDKVELAEKVLFNQILTALPCSLVPKLSDGFIFLVSFRFSLFFTFRPTYIILLKIFFESNFWRN